MSLPLEKPDAVTVNVEQATETVVRLKWTAPFNGNTEILYFTVTYTIAPGLRFAENVSSDTLEFTARKLEPGTAYTFHVTATNALGTSAPASVVATTYGGGENKLECTHVVNYC